LPFVELQKLSDEGTAWGRYCYEKSANFAELSDEVIEILVEQAPLRSSPLSALLMVRLDGAYSDVPEGDTAFGGTRTPQFAVFMTGVSLEHEQMATDRDWVRSCWQALQPYAIGIGGYVNSMTELEGDRVRAAYGEKYPRLARIKAEYDPQNVFHRNLNILPG
jgi:FAD/FMN-containing dehydrogenase